MVRSRYILEILSLSRGSIYNTRGDDYFFTTRSGHKYITKVDLTPLTNNGYVGRINFGSSTNGKDLDKSLTGYHESFEVLSHLVSILMNVSHKYRIVAFEFEAIGPRVPLYYAIIRHYESKIGYKLVSKDRDETGYTHFLLMNRTVTPEERNSLDLFYGFEG